MHLNHHRGGAGPPLVLLHGIGSRWQMWDPVLERLEAKRDVVALDLPGFAGSPPPPPGTPAGVTSLTRLVSEFLDEIGLERPHAAGNSMGGRIALELAKQGRVRSVTALSPSGFHSEREAAFQRASLWTSVRAARMIAPRAEKMMASQIGRTITLGQYVAKPRRVSAADAAASVRALANAGWFDETLPAITAEHFTGGDQIHVPVTIAWGEHDRLHRRRQADRAARAIPNSRVITLRGCGHVPTYDDPDQVARVVLEGSAS